MPERTSSSNEYRYGFNGKEKDEDEEWGDLTHYDYGFRIYNPGIGRFLSVDPLSPQYPFYTPYQFAGNKPIVALDLDGLEEIHYKVIIDRKNNTATISYSHSEDIIDEILVIDREPQQWLDPGEHHIEIRKNKSFPIQIELDYRDKCMLGLLVFQGVTTRELVDLDLSEVNLKSQTIEIKASRVTVGRRLVLRDCQIKNLRYYLRRVRPSLLALKLKPTQQFFLTNGSSEKRAALRNGIQGMNDKLKDRSPLYKNTRQLRASVISNWLLEASLRQVQYMAGHKYISSTERYRLGRILEVEEALLKYHPKR